MLHIILLKLADHVITEIPPRLSPQYYWLFVLSRVLVGIGESSYSSISPTIIGDLFTNNTRTMMLSVFYLAIPLGRYGILGPGLWLGIPEGGSLAKLAKRHIVTVMELRHAAALNVSLL